MTTDARKLTIAADATILEALRVIDDGGASIAFVVDEVGRVIGSVTDGDLRRALLAGAALDGRCLTHAMRRGFVYVTAETGRAEVLDLMRARQVEQIPILDTDGRLCGLHTVQEFIAPAQRPNAAVILAGGLGTRLQPLTESIPKPMIRVAGRPILERLVLHLMSHGIRRFYLSVNYLAHVIEEHFGDGSRFGCTIAYLREDKPLGTGGPLSLLPDLETPVLVANGDLVTQCDVGRMLSFHEAGDYVATFGLRPYTVAIPFGVASVRGDRLVDLREKPTERMLINAGIYVLSPCAVALVPKDVHYPITDLFSRLVSEGRPVGAHVVQDDWLDVGQHEELRRARGDA